MKKTTLKIEGMACNMCETHMNEAIRNAFDVKKVISSHKKNETVIISEEEFEQQALKAAVDEAGYELKEIRVEPYAKKGLFSFK